VARGRGVTKRNSGLLTVFPSSAREKRGGDQGNVLDRIGLPRQQKRRKNVVFGKAECMELQTIHEYDRDSLRGRENKGD